MTNVKEKFFLGKNDLASQYAILPVPYEKTVSYGKGTKRGPNAIIEASLQIEDMDDELLMPYDVGAYTLPAMKLNALSTPKALDNIFKTALKILQKKHTLISLGGEHTITLPLVKATASIFESISVLQLDAHFDLHDNFRGDVLSHACVMRRILEISNKINVVPVGIRSIASEEYEFVKKNNIAFFHASKCCAGKTDWITDVIENLKENVYITFDVDVFDTSILPGTGTPEPAGPKWDAVLMLLKEVCKKRKIVAADFVELAPIKGMVSNEYTIARLILKFLMYHKHFKG